MCRGFCVVKGTQGDKNMWLVTYADGSTEEFSEDNTLELVCASLDDRKSVIRIERINS